jgi:hypothetical protein
MPDAIKSKTSSAASAASAASASSAPRRSARDAAARARAQAVLDELDQRYEPGWWRQHWRREGVILIALALGIVVAGTVTTLRRRRLAGWA